MLAGLAPAGMAASFAARSKGEILAASHVFRFTPESGLKSDIARCLERANTGTRRAIRSPRRHERSDNDAAATPSDEKLGLLLPSGARKVIVPFVRAAHERHKPPESKITWAYLGDGNAHQRLLFFGCFSFN